MRPREKRKAMNFKQTNLLKPCIGLNTELGYKAENKIQENFVKVEMIVFPDNL